MRLSVVFLTLLLATPAAPVSAASIDDLAWLAGDRVSRGERSTVREVWIGPSGGMLLGMSVTARGPGHRAGYEYMRIAADPDGNLVAPGNDGELAFFASPSSQAPTTFRLKSLAPGEVVFENLANDFPQRVIYRDLGDGRIAARIEGESLGEMQSIDWTFEPRGK